MNYYLWYHQFSMSPDITQCPPVRGIPFATIYPCRGITNKMNSPGAGNNNKVVIRIISENLIDVLFGIAEALPYRAHPGISCYRHCLFAP